MVSPEMPCEVTKLTMRMVSLDEQAFQEFHRLYHPRLFRYAFVLSHGRSEDAHDIVQDVMLKVIRHIKPFVDEGAFWNWLTCLVKSSAIDRARKRSRWDSFFHRWIDRFSTRDARQHAAIDNGMSVELLQVALSKLPAAESNLLRSKYIDGTCVRELAHRMDVTEKAIESRLFRARNALRRELELLAEQESQS